MNVAFHSFLSPYARARAHTHTLHANLLKRIPCARISNYMVVSFLTCIKVNCFKIIKVVTCGTRYLSKVL
ncbi:hypothetical protein [Candidatus Hodgkinia cicadicola]|uniref:hypothetical protein n=1 Tax=Candidatus Hodgkinia cicadicola TaxID=573658 RepID=UPI0011BA85BE